MYGDCFDVRSDFGNVKHVTYWGMRFWTAIYDSAGTEIWNKRMHILIQPCQRLYGATEALKNNARRFSSTRVIIIKIETYDCDSELQKLLVQGSMLVEIV